MIRLSTHRGVILRFFMNGLRLGLAAAVFLPGIVAAVNANAQGVAAIVIRMDDRSLPAGSASLPAGMQQALASALGVTSTMGERTRDGAFTLKLSTPLAVDAARAALNRIRSMPGVLYANEAPGAPAPATTGRPTDRLIVKYRDASPSSTTRAGTPLAAARIERISALAGVPVAWMRAGHDGYDVLRMLQRLPIARVEAIAATIAQDADVEYAQPDYIRTRQVVPTDPCYASASVGACSGGYQWDLFDPVGGINMPAAWNITTGSAAINVAVIDTGALFNHPDLAGRFVGGYDMIADCAVANDGQPMPCTWSAQAPA